MSFLRDQWRDISGHVKFWLITVVVAALVPFFTWLTHGLTRLQQTGLIALFSVVITWAVVQTMYSAKQKQKASQQTSLQPAIKAGGLEENVQAVEKFYRDHNGPLLLEIEALFQRLAAHYADAAERQQFLIRALTSSALTWLHDSTWASIFRSQYDLLQELNGTPAGTLNNARPHYDRAAAAYPEIYAHYSFESWLGYMTEQNIIRQDGNVLQITVRGIEFLKWVVQEHYSPASRLY